MNQIIPHPSNACISCGAGLSGNFCPHCGEKKLNPAKDYSLGKFLEQTIDALSHFDSKFLRSFKALLFKPGFLTAEFIQGRRIRYMKPVQIFLVATVLFYLIYPTASTFFASLSDIKQQNLFRFDVSKGLRKKIDADSSSLRIVVKNVQVAAAHKSKAFLFLLIPFWGLAFYLLFRRSLSFLVPSIVFAVHNLSLFLLLYMIYITVFLVFGFSNVGDRQLIPFAILFAGYLFIAIRKVYRQSVFVSLIKTLAAFFIFIALFVVYRQTITLWALIS